MSILRYIERIDRIDRLIRMKATGTPADLAYRLEVSESCVKKTIQDMRELGAPIAFCFYRNSYTYRYETKFKVEFLKPLESKDLQSLQAGFINKLANNGQSIVHLLFQRM